MSELDPDLALPDDAGAAELPGAELPDDGGELDWRGDLEAALTGADDDAAADDAREDLRREFGRAAETKASEDAEKAWRRELNQLLEPARPALNSVGKGSKHAIRSVLKAEALLRSDPVAGVSRIVDLYTGHLDGAAKAQLASAVLGRLGYSGPDQIGQAERQRLAEYDHAQRQEHAANVQALNSAAQALDAFARTAPHLETVRGLMASLMMSGESATLPEAYAAACRYKGLTTSAETAAQAQRQAIAKARAARTPRTASSPVPADEDDDENLSTAQVLRKVWRQQVNAR